MFIYVFSERDKISLLSAGFTLLKEDPKMGVYIFAKDRVDTETVFELTELERYCMSDVLTF